MQESGLRGVTQSGGGKERAQTPTLGGGGVPRGTAVEKKDLDAMHRDGESRTTVSLGGGGAAQAVDTTPTLGALEVATTDSRMTGPDGAQFTTQQRGGAGVQG